MYGAKRKYFIPQKLFSKLNKEDTGVGDSPQLQSSKLSKVCAKVSRLLQKTCIIANNLLI